MPLDLPALSDEPSTSHRDCCASLSRKLFISIAQCVPRTNSLVLSVGCGSGLLEAHLQHQFPHLCVEGAEVPSCPVKYLSEDRINIVAGTWETCRQADEAGTWLFVYPRNPLLVTDYVKKHHKGCVERIIWIGPCEDWKNFREAVMQTGFDMLQEVEDNGLSIYESMWMITKSGPPTSVSLQHEVPAFEIEQCGFKRTIATLE